MNNLSTKQKQKQNRDTQNKDKTSFKITTVTEEIYKLRKNVRNFGNESNRFIIFSYVCVEDNLAILKILSLFCYIFDECVNRCHTKPPLLFQHFLHCSSFVILTVLSCVHCFPSINIIVFALILASSQPFAITNCLTIPNEL